ncbi:DUF4245 domain-containing protein [Nonomuraea sp. bgisy101]|uniref:DUF4245 domain-containing protein n=1 Tax=Nonomuraea sp. bgisy101 TaxID=3413784 RepID=UPI003D71F993
MRRFTQGFYGYAFALFVCLALAVIIVVTAPTGREGQHVPRLDYTITVANYNRSVPYEVWAPAKDPADWIPNSNRIAKGADNSSVLSIGYATAPDAEDERHHAMIVQGAEKPPAAFASRIANSDKSIGTVQIAGANWEKRFREDKNQRTLVRFLPDTTLMVTGTADWPELTTLASTLKQQPKPAN